MLDEASAEAWYWRLVDSLCKRESFDIGAIRDPDDPSLSRSLQRIFEYAAGGAVTAGPGAAPVVGTASRLALAESRSKLYALPVISKSEHPVSIPPTFMGDIPAPMLELLRAYGWLPVSGWATFQSIAAIDPMDLFSARAQKAEAAMSYLAARVASVQVKAMFRIQQHLRYVICVGTQGADPAVFGEPIANMKVQRGSTALQVVSSTPRDPRAPDGFYRAFNHGLITFQRQCLPDVCGGAKDLVWSYAPAQNGVECLLLEGVGQPHGWRLNSCPFEDRLHFAQRIFNRLVGCNLTQEEPGKQRFYLPVC